MTETRRGIQTERLQSVQEPSGQTDLPPKPSKRLPWKWKNLPAAASLGAFGIIVLILLYSFVYRTLIEPPVEPEVVQGGKAHVIQLDVLNGTGTPKLGQRFTEFLRARGFDVVELGNYKETNVALTRVIDRVGNAQAAHQVAQALGVSAEHVVQEIDRNAYLDVTVVIGKDFRSLRPMQ